jgi:hypothetical protein
MFMAFSWFLVVSSNSGRLVRRAFEPGRHCERSEAIQPEPAADAALDCFVASLLAMTVDAHQS